MFIGLDFGTTGTRICVLDKAGDIAHEERVLYPNTSQTPLDWRETLYALLRGIPIHLAKQVQRISVDGTSGTVLLCDADLSPILPALLYNDSRAQAQAESLKQLATPQHIVCNASSGLAKFLWLTQNADITHANYFLHQSDWLSALLTGIGGVSDYHNALKSGYDVEQLCWPEWIEKLPHAHLLPHVLEPGQLIAEINPAVAAQFNLNPDCTVHAGTTDSIAAFIAADVHQPGDAVTSLGTTLVLKLLSESRVEAQQYGIYSHRYGNFWLAGGASNSGAGVLSQYFSDTQLVELSKYIDVAIESPFDYYPLPRKGERFPINNPELEPRLYPRPADDVEFLHGLLQGLSRIEAMGYSRLAELGATALTTVRTCGGGAGNPTWQQIRTGLLKVPVHRSAHAEAAFGAALLAKQAGII